MTEKFLRRCAGTVRFAVIGRGAERLWNETGAIPVWDISSESGEVYATVSAGQYRALAHKAHEMGLRLSVRAKKGLPFRWKRLCCRPGVAVGLVLFLLIQWSWSARIWSIEIVGAGSAEAAVAQAVYEYGVRTGMRSDLLCEKDTVLHLLRSVPTLSWASVNRLGSTLTVEVRLRRVTEVTPETPCNLVARCGGEIVRTQALDGFPVVRAGDTVQAGDLLVEGLRVSETGTVLHHAHGAVFARTVRTFTVTQPLTYSTREAGQTVTRKQLALFGLMIPLNLRRTPTGAYERTFTETPWVIGGQKLPVSVYTETWTEQRDVQHTCSAGEAEWLARAEIERQMTAALAGTEIVSVQEEAVCRAGVLTLMRTVLCIEDIAEPRVIETAE